MTLGPVGPAPKPEPRRKRRFGKDRRLVDWPQITRDLAARDGGCVYRLHLGADDFCRDKWGEIISPAAVRLLERDHVLQAAGMSMKAADAVEELVLGCPFHHRGGYATRRDVRDAVRAYLRGKHPDYYQHLGGEAGASARDGASNGAPS